MKNKIKKQNSFQGILWSCFFALAMFMVSQSSFADSSIRVTTIIEDGGLQPIYAGGYISNYVKENIIKKGIIVSKSPADMKISDDTQFDVADMFLQIVVWGADRPEDIRFIDCTSTNEEQYFCTLQYLMGNTDYYVRAFVIEGNNNVIYGNIETIHTENYDRYDGPAAYGNVWYAFQHTLFDVVTDEIIDPYNGFYYSTNENPTTVKFQKGTGYNTCYKFATEWNYKLWFHHNTAHCDENKIVSMPIIKYKNGKVEISKAETDNNKNITIYYSINGDGSRPENFTQSYTSPLTVNENSIVYCYAISSDGYMSYTNRYIVRDFVDNGSDEPFDLTTTIIDGITYYEIDDAADLVTFAKLINQGEYNANAVLTADIDLNGVEWTPIGNADIKYTGIFDGRGHTITGFNYTATADYNGLFGYINAATIKNFSISGTLTSQNDWNGVVGKADGSSVVSGIYSSLTINVSDYAAHTGGIVGGTGFIGHTLLVENCEYSGTLTHSGEGDCQAGILGYTRSGGVRNCIFSGTIIGENSMYGGILAYCKTPDFLGVQNCLSVGKIVAAEGCTTAAAIIANWNGGTTTNVKNNYYCLREGSTTAIAIGNNASNCETPHKVTTGQLASGEICYALNDDQTEINWYQTLGEDNYPVLDNSHKPVIFINGFYANEVHQYTISFDSNGGSSIESITQDVGSAITPPENPTREGYTFIGWEPAIPETMPVGGLTCVAQWQINNYTLTYLVDGEEYKTFSMEYNSSITPEDIPVKEGYTFSGWSEIPETMPAHDVIVTGSFVINSYTLVYIVDGVEYSRSEVEYGATITPLEAPTKEGYTFSGWSYMPATMPAASVVISGSFTINSYTLTYKVDGEEYKSSTVVYGSEIIPEEEPTKEGYTFSGWSEIPETMPANDVVVTGSFTVNSYTLSYIVDGEEYKTASVAYGTALVPEEEPNKEGYTFSGWSEIPETMPAEDVTVTGSFTINQYLLTYIIDGEEYKSYEVDYNTTLTPEPAPVKKGMTFSGWGIMPATMPAHDLTFTGTYSWSKETVDGVIYQVADTLKNYVTVIGCNNTREAELLSDIEIGGDVYTVYSIAEDALPHTITLYTSVGRLLLWLWSNEYTDIKEAETGDDLSAPILSLVKATASSLRLSFVNPYPELTETVKVSGSAVKKGENGYEIALTGLEPDNLYDELATITLTFEDASYTKFYSFKTEPLTITALQPKVVSLGNVIVTAESNLDDEEANVGFEWRRVDWTDEFESRTGAAYLYEGIMEGYIRSLNTDRLWKFRPYYTSDAGNTYYSDWKGMDPSDYSFFEPTVHTYEPIAVTDSTAEVKGYAMRGTDDVASQGFVYWQNTPSSSSRRNAKGVPVDATIVEVSGHVMKATLSDLEYDTEYCFAAFVTTSEGETFYGEQQTFRTSFDPDGIEEVHSSESIVHSSTGIYDLSGRKIVNGQSSMVNGKLPKGINIIRYSDGTTRKVLIK